MQQSELLSLVEQLIPAYKAPDFEQLLDQLTRDEPVSTKVIVKMELNRLMAPCVKSIDLRKRVLGECREYTLDGRTHWLDDVAINSYHKKIKRFGGYTQGVYEAMTNTRNNYRVMHQQPENTPILALGDDESPFWVEPIKLGLVLNRQEKRLKMSTQVDIRLVDGQIIHAVSVDLSRSGVKLKVPSAFDYNLGEIFAANFVELQQQSQLVDLKKAISYRIIGIEECYENNSIRWIRALKVSNTDAISDAINIVQANAGSKTIHNEQDKVLQARTHGYEHTYIKHTQALPLFFSGSTLKFAVLNDFNKEVWDYWHDERYQHSFGSLFSSSRMDLLAPNGANHSSNVIYSFVYQYQNKDLHYSLMLPEASIEERQLFWHSGAHRSSWKVFRINIYELTDNEKDNFHGLSDRIDDSDITHYGLLQEISGVEAQRDYQLIEKSTLKSSALNRFRHSRKTIGSPKGIYYDVTSRRKEERYEFRSPISILNDKTTAISGEIVNFSTSGLLVVLTQPLAKKINDTVKVNLIELQRYDDSVPLSDVRYTIVQISRNGLMLHLSLEENSKTTRAMSFIKKLITYNKDKLKATKEDLPSIDFLHTVYDVILPRLASTPFYIAKIKNVLQPRAIGVNYPLSAHFKLLQHLEQKDKLSFEPIFKGRTGRLLKNPIRPVPNARHDLHEMYVAVIKKDNQVTSIHSKLNDEFSSLQERLRFIKRSKLLGEFHALRISGLPVAPTSPSTQMLAIKLNELATTLHHAAALEKEFESIIGFGEIIDITEEVLIRLELT